MLLHHVMSPLILGIMFFAVFTPIGLWMRLVGKRPLDLRFDAAADSYWVHRKPPAPEHRPFCSARCKQIDLGRWLGEAYRVPSEERREGEAAPAEGEE